MKYTLKVTSNFYEPLYFSRKATFIFDENKQSAFEEDTKKVLTEATIKNFIIRESKRSTSILYHKSMIIDQLVIQVEFTKGDLEEYSKEIIYCGKKMYVIPNTKQDKIDDLEHDIELLKNQIDEVDDDIRDLENTKEEYEDEIDKLQKQIDKLEVLA